MKALDSILQAFHRWFMAVVLWRERHVKERTFVIVLALIVGLLGGFAALLLKWCIYTIERLLTAHLNVDSGNYILLLLPVVGIILTAMYVKYGVKENISHGVTRVLYAISQKKSRLKRRGMYSNIIASSITIGFGGSVGSEGPIVYTGAAIGSNVGQWFRMSPKVLMVLVGCGAAAGIAAMFKAPIAGMLFTLEVLMLDLNAVSIMPLLISSITAATVAYGFTGYDVEFFFVQSEPFVTPRIPYVILLGVVSGFGGLYFTKVMTGMESMFRHMNAQWKRFAVGGAVIALLLFLFPPLYGEGYDMIGCLLEGKAASLLDGSIFYQETEGGGVNAWYLLGFVAMLTLVKGFATSATNGAGGVGGTFAPTLFVGALTGFCFAFMMNLVFGLDLSVKNFTLLGMTGVMSAVMHAPLMAIFLTAELTGGYDLFLPLLIASTIAYGTIKMFTPYSIYAVRLARRGELLTHHKDKAVLTLLKTRNVIETDLTPVSPEMTLKDMVAVISQSNRNIFPVLNERRQLMGVVLLDDIRNIMFRPDLYKKMHVEKFMTVPPASILINESMDSVMKKFDETGAWNLPVVDDKGVYIGFVSKSKIFNSYRRVLRHYSED